MAKTKIMAEETPAPKIVPLTADEIRALLIIVDQFRAAQARMAMAQELEAQLLAQLRTKRGLDDRWQCFDALEGFMLIEEVPSE